VVASPAAIGIKPIVTPNLIHAADHGADTRAISHHGRQAVVAHPAALSINPIVTVDLCGIALLSPGRGADNTRARSSISRTASQTPGLAEVSHPAAIGVSAQVTPLLQLPVTVVGADARAAIKLVDLVQAVVAIPTALRRAAGITGDLSLIACLDPVLWTGTSS